MRDLNEMYNDEPENVAKREWNHQAKLYGWESWDELNDDDKAPLITEVIRMYNER